VTIFGRKKAPALPAPRRQEHPNARIEAEFQRIDSLRRDVARKETELDAAPAEIGRLRRKAVFEGGHTGKMCTTQADALERRLPELTTQIQGLHDQITKAIEPFDDDDLLFLNTNRR